MAEGHQLSTSRLISTTLDIKDLNTVLTKLSLFPKDKWRGFGLKAGLYDPTLSAIEADHPKDVEECFRKCVSLWLKRSEGVDEEGAPTWLRLGDILEEMGENVLADDIRRHGTGTSISLTKSDSAGTTKHVYTVPYELSFEYSKMNNQFSFVLSKFADEIIQGKLLDDFKAFLLGRSPHQSEGREREGTESKDEIMKVCNKLGLVSLLRKYFFLSNFGALMLFAEEYNFVASNALLDFSKKIDDLYSKILAKDFARQAIEDHEKLVYHGEMIFKVVWSFNTSLKEFQQFLADAFHRHGILISLRVVHHSVLTFVCTIPKWLVEEMKEYVTKNEEMLKSKKVVELIIEGTIMFSVKDLAKEIEEEDISFIDSFEYFSQKTRIKIQELRDKEEPINILVIGPTGSGKSTIVNALMGKDVTLICHGVESVQSEMDKYEGKIMGVKIKIYDTTGFGDTRGKSGEHIVREIAKNNKFDLILICLKFDSRAYGDVKDMFTTLKKEISKEMWERSVIVLTFTNMFLQLGSMKQLKDEEKEERIRYKIVAFQEKIFDFLSGEVTEETMRNIPFCIAGEEDEKQLPTTENWLVALWESCIDRCSDGSRRLQKFYLTRRILGITGNISLPTVTGAVAGGIIGAGVGVVGHVPGMVGGAAVGAVAGATIMGSVSGAIVGKDTQKKKKV